MKKFKNYSYLLFFAAQVLGILGCKKVLDIPPTDKIEVDAVFGNSEGVKFYIGNLYWQMPIEDFAYFNNGFNRNEPGPNNGGQNPTMSTDEAIHSEAGGLTTGSDWWTQGYGLIRDVNILIDYIPKLDISAADKNLLIGESRFVRAWAYYGLALRYGGVPIIAATQPLSDDLNSLKVPRSTEEATYDFILSQLDTAIANLPDNWGDDRRATKWTAYGLKSRVALYAASLSKFGNKAVLTGEAADKKLIGMPANKANDYYSQCIAASEAIMNSGKFALYQPNPADPATATENYRKLFLDPSVAFNPRGVGEVIFMRGYALPLDRRGHNYDIWYNPAQLANGWPHPGRMNVSLDLVDAYEDYTDPGKSKPVLTTNNGDLSYADYSSAKDATYLHFSDPLAPFKNKDARMHATAVLPYSTMKGAQIIIQAGLIRSNGTARIRTIDTGIINGSVYHSYGGPSSGDYSGFDPIGGNNTKTGFLFRKFIQDAPVNNGWNKSIQDWAEMRYAEVLLNYAEAVVESGQGSPVKAAEALNATRKRAAFTSTIPLTIENVMRERRVELAFENKRWWDLFRRREYHEVFNAQLIHAIHPIRDLRRPQPDFIFIRTNAHGQSPRTFQRFNYYRRIPGVETTGVIQNPSA